VDAAKHPAMTELAHDIHGVWAMTVHGFMTAPLYLALGGVLMAWFFYMVKPEIPAALKAFFQKIKVYQLLENKYGVDWIYENVFARGGRFVGNLLWQVGDRGLIDGLLVNGSWKTVGWVAGAVRWFQSGYIFQYALVMILGVFVLMSYFVFGPTK